MGIGVLFFFQNCGQDYQAQLDNSSNGRLSVQISEDEMGSDIDLLSTHAFEFNEGEDIDLSLKLPVAPLVDKRYRLHVYEINGGNSDVIEGYTEGYIQPNAEFSVPVAAGERDIILEIPINPAVSLFDEFEVHISVADESYKDGLAPFTAFKIKISLAKDEIPDENL